MSRPYVGTRYKERLHKTSILIISLIFASKTNHPFLKCEDHKHPERRWEEPKPTLLPNEILSRTRFEQNPIRIDPMLCMSLVMKTPGSFRMTEQKRRSKKLFRRHLGSSLNSYPKADHTLESRFCNSLTVYMSSYISS